eukprot:INCI9513.1.p1 GENE.INCI9513.1~~INCI9513.1.p1  ORF type:complete len:254 (+),score=25.88 INCI9513.1:240-1001(+)
MRPRLMTNLLIALRCCTTRWKDRKISSFSFFVNLSIFAVHINCPNHIIVGVVPGNGEVATLRQEACDRARIRWKHKVVTILGLRRSVAPMDSAATVTWCAQPFKKLLGPERSLSIVVVSFIVVVVIYCSVRECSGYNTVAASSFAVGPIARSSATIDSVHRRLQLILACLFRTQKLCQIYVLEMPTAHRLRFADELRDCCPISNTVRFEAFHKRALVVYVPSTVKELLVAVEIDAILVGGQMGFVGIPGSKAF